MAIVIENYIAARSHKLREVLIVPLDAGIRVIAIDDQHVVVAPAGRFDGPCVRAQMLDERQLVGFDLSA